MIESERLSDSRLYLLGSSVVYYRRTFLPHRDCVKMRMYLCIYRYVGTYILHLYVIRIVRAEYRYRMRCMNHSFTQLSKSFQVITLSDFKLSPMSLIRKLYCNIATVIYILACWPCSRYCTCSPPHATRPFQGTDDQRSRSSLWSMRIRTGTRMGA